MTPNNPTERTLHWDRIYGIRPGKECSWFQATPEPSLGIIQRIAPNLDAHIIDIGGGDGLLVDHLLDLGYSNLTVLDISEKAIERAKQRLGTRSNSIQWVVCDVTEFEPTKTYDVWHDRAAFHFLRDEGQIQTYTRVAQQSLNPGGHLFLGTFSTDGPTKCSGLEIQQYNQDSMKSVIEPVGFTNQQWVTDAHITPSESVQNFLFGLFQRK